MKRLTIIAIAVLLLLLAVRIYPAALNEYPKGSDTWYHLERARDILQGSIFYDKLNAGGTVSSYPPLFHLLIAPVLFTADPLQSSKFLAPLIGFLAVLAFFLFARKLTDEKAAVVATFVFGAAVEIVNTSIFLSPENLGFVFMFLALYFQLCENSRLFVVFSILLALTHALSFIVFLVLSVALGRKHIKFILPSLIVAAMWTLGMKLAGAYTQVILGNPVSLGQYVFGFSPIFLALAMLGMGKDTKNLSIAFLALTLYSFLIGAYPDRIFTFSIIPAALLAGIGFMKYWKLLESRQVKAALIILLVIAALFVFDFAYAQTELKRDDKAMLDWIKDNTEKDATIAARWQVSGSWMPFLAGRKNILGSFQESVPDYLQRRADLDIIFSSNDKSRIVQAMARYNASYIYVNEVEDVLLSPGSVNRLSNMFKEVAGNGYAHIYKI